MNTHTHMSINTHTHTHTHTHTQRWLQQYMHETVEEYHDTEYEPGINWPQFKMPTDSEIEVCGCVCVIKCVCG